MSNGYLVISADCHAGPDSPVYREYLDPQYRDRFDDELAARDALMQQMRTRALRHRRRRVRRQRGVPGGVVRRGRGRQQPPRGRTARRVGRQEARRGAVGRRRDRRGRLPRPRRGHRQDGRAVRRRLRHRQHRRSRARARGRTCVQPLGRRALRGEPAATRRSHRRADPRRHRRRDRRDHARARRRPVGRRDHPRAVGRVPVVHELPLRPDLGAVRVADAAGAHALGSGRARRLRRGARRARALRDRDGVVDVAADVVPLVVGRVRALPRSSRWRSPSRGRTGRPTCSGAWIR